MCRLTLASDSEFNDAQTQSFRGVLFFGTRKTFDSTEPTLEVHVLDFPKRLQVLSARIQILAQIREPQKFVNEAELIAAIEEDCRFARGFIF